MILFIFYLKISIKNNYIHNKMIDIHINIFDHINIYIHIYTYIGY